MTPFSQDAWACRCEWGPVAPAALAPADVTIVVDVFSFTTCVDVAVSRGAAILPYAWNDASAAEFAGGAELSGRRRRMYSLSPRAAGPALCPSVAEWRGISWPLERRRSLSQDLCAMQLPSLMRRSGSAGPSM